MRDRDEMVHRSAVGCILVGCQSRDREELEVAVSIYLPLVPAPVRRMMPDGHEGECRRRAGHRGYKGGREHCERTSHRRDEGVCESSEQVCRTPRGSWCVGHCESKDGRLTNAWGALRD